MRQNTILLAVLSVAIIGVITITPAIADEDLLAKIASLEKKVSDKDAIIMEQVKVILMIKDNYKATYPKFSLENYPDTEGFPTEWLEGERSKIKASCALELADGYQSPWCKYVR